jgi:hypothetical protein
MADEARPEAGMTRRCLLRCAGGVAVGTAALAVAGGPSVLPVAQAKESPTPWPYKKLDPAEVAAIAYERYPSGLCMNSVVAALITPLRASVGEPYASFPADAFVWGHGGVVGWGTMCGTILGASVVANLVCGPGPLKGGELVVNELVHFYAESVLPTWVPPKPRVAAPPLPAKPGSPLCHISVGTWMKKANHGFFSPERKDRCARVAASVAAQTARYLNDWSEGKFKPQHKFQTVLYDVTSQDNCAACHRGEAPEAVTTGNP